MSENAAGEGPVDRPVGHPVWENGFAANLEAAAEDADKWMELIERLHNDGAGPWKFSQRDSLAKLRACRRILRGFLSHNCATISRSRRPSAALAG